MDIHTYIHTNMHTNCTIRGLLILGFGHSHIHGEPGCIEAVILQLWVLYNGAHLLLFHVDLSLRTAQYRYADASTHCTAHICGGPSNTHAQQPQRKKQQPQRESNSRSVEATCKGRCVCWNGPLCSWLAFIRISSQHIWLSKPANKVAHVCNLWTDLISIKNADLGTWIRIHFASHAGIIVVWADPIREPMHNRCMI